MEMITLKIYLTYAIYYEFL